MVLSDISTKIVDGDFRTFFRIKFYYFHIFFIPLANVEKDIVSPLDMLYNVGDKND